MTSVARLGLPLYLVGIVISCRSAAHISVGANQGPTIYVSPSGKDANPGTKSAPILTLGHARDLVRGIDGHMKQDVTVRLASGTYRIEKTLTLSARDSGTNGHNVIWTAAKGATPIINGGIRVSGWHLSDAANNIWAATLPAHLRTRQMYVNGVRATPANGLAPGELTETSTGYMTDSTAMDGWRNPSGIRFVYMGGLGKMTEPSCPVASISQTTITMAEPCWRNSNTRPYTAVQTGPLTPSTPTYIENAYELLQNPGEYYLDLSTHQVYYIPRPGESMTTADVEMPARAYLVEATGTPGHPVHNIIFSGIQFSYSTWMQPSSPVGMSEMQSNFTVTTTPDQGLCHLDGLDSTCPYGNWTKEPGALQFSYDTHIGFDHDQFVHLGSAGLNLDNGSQFDRVQGCVFTDISGNGLELGNVDLPEAAIHKQTMGNTVTDNHFFAIGAEYKGAVAILVGYASHTTISHNQIDNIPYAGISLGWGGWPDKVNQPPVPNNSHDNTVSDNLIFDYMQDLSDGGAVYTQGITGTSMANGERVTGNIAHDQVMWSEAMKSDDGATYVTYSGNVMYNDTYDWGAYHADTSGDGQPWDLGAVVNNYWQQGYPSSDMQGVTSSRNVLIGGPEDVPASIIKSAGIEPGHASILSWRPGGEGLPYPPEAPVTFSFAGGTAYITWHPSPDLPGLRVVSYTVTPCVWPGGAITCQEQPANAQTFPASTYTQTGYVIMSAPGDGTYSFVITANNAKGASTVSIPTTPVSAATAVQPQTPTAPQKLSVKPMRGAVRLFWYPPQSASCALSDTVWCDQPVLYYTVSDQYGGSYTVSGISQFLISNHGARVIHILKGLTSGKAYNLSIVGVTPAGPGASASVPAVTPS